MRKLALRRWRTRDVQVPSSGSSELERLIRLRFPAEGKAERVARALDALYQQPTIRLTKAQWKRIVETNVEDQY